MKITVHYWRIKGRSGFNFTGSDSWNCNYADDIPSMLDMIRRRSPGAAFIRMHEVKRPRPTTVRFTPAMSARFNGYNWDGDQSQSRGWM